MAEYLIEAETRAADGSITTALFHSGVGFNRGGLGYYRPGVKNPLELRRTMFADGSTSGSVATGAGGVDLINFGAFDWIVSRGLAGGKITIKLVEPGAAYADVVTLGVLVMEQPESSFDGLSLVIRDRLFELEKKLVQTTVFAGTNVGPAGLEGTADDLKGKPKPYLFGKGEEIPAVLVSGQRNIYQVSTGAADVTAIFDRGAPIAISTPYSSQADMEANVPTGGQARVWAAGGMFRLGSSAVGLVTCNANAGATAADRTVAQILKAMATGPGGIDAGDVVSADVTALDAANSAEVGLWVSAESSVRAAMELIANSIGAWFGFDRLGRLRMGRLVAPSGTPVATLRKISIRDAAGPTEFPIIEIDRTPANDEGRGVPPWRILLSYRPIEATQTSDLAGSLSGDRKGYLSQAVRQVSADAPSVLTQFPGAGKRTFETRLFDVTAAQAEADRLRDLHQVLRSRYRVKITYRLAQAQLIDIGSVVQLKFDRFGLDAGKLHLVIGIDYDASTETAVLDLWG